MEKTSFIKKSVNEVGKQVKASTKDQITETIGLLVLGSYVTELNNFRFKILNGCRFRMSLLHRFRISGLVSDLFLPSLIIDGKKRVFAIHLDTWPSQLFVNLWVVL